MPANVVIDKLAWIEIRDGSILSTRSKGKDVYYIPGGKRETGENDVDALVREIREELSVVLVLSTLRYLKTFQAPAHGQPAGTEVKMTCYTGQYEGSLRAAAEIAEVVWLTYADYGKIGPVDQLIFDWLKERGKLLY